MGAPTTYPDKEEEEERKKVGGAGAGGGGGGGVGLRVTDDVDLLGEILGRLDGRSLAAAACVCRAWHAAARSDRVWESLCLRHHAISASPSPAAAARSAVVAALGGYRALYRLCVGPALHRLAAGPDLSPLALSLSLSLFSIDRYERLAGGPHRPASLLFLCNPNLNSPLDVS